ncbi:TetR family transcriptional regulator [Nocardia implantans]|uniref:TetR/AcrR family transcriptional regulator n=1 Tax=Nocardia implantans TaxID=3108168 RepID=A0ABU6AVU4_9NOCA|nr:MULTISPECIES: TetR family transcriptional regulator [unclassified Nocardia]MBF6192534.1 TetR family transcriptional regulator [Nocardia beijingensis]MEA3527561.1 TetR/AcrR family transcriptional regulator [Nocardia sp. CDC192]MEB3511269.1 TetR/AcrR family transcriptional regulator [Nocardia sp. CDC186]
MRPESSTGGQRRSFIEEARRRQIIAAAVEVISEGGYANASLARIAERAGISKGVISYHFEGKDDLMTQLVVQLYVSAAEYIAPRVAAAAGPRAGLLAYLESNLGFIDANTTYVAALVEVVTNLRDADGNPKFSSADGERDIIAPLADILAEGQRGGEFGEFDPLLMAKSIRDAIDGAAGRAVREPDFAMDAYASHLCRLFDAATRKG